MKAPNTVRSRLLKALGKVLYGEVLYGRRPTTSEITDAVLKALNWQGAPEIVIEGSLLAGMFDDADEGTYKLIRVDE